MSQRLKWLLSLTLLVSVLTACGGGAAQPTTNPLDPSLVQNPPPTQAPPPTIAPASLPTSDSAGGEPLVAKVNGQPITLAEFERAVTRREQEVSDAASPAALQADVLDQLIEQALIQQGAAAQNITITDDQVQAELQTNIELAGSQSAWDQWLTTNLYTADEFLTTLRATLITNRVRDQLTSDLEGNIRQVHARHILVRTQDEAQAVYNRLNAGEDFAAVAAEISLDETTKQIGGDLGWFTPEELLVPELSQAAFALQPGEISQPIGTELGYHIIQTIEFAERPVDPDRRVYIAQARFENWLRPLYESAVIERYL